ncbi:cupin domain-containing protein [Pedobacter frigoris]|uniref:hypothetical protein n=1 Tax=Pedobacter frigoris TaxID=2571272 RepID=UPI00268AA86C|nr:hypothetical protein [Pedobacter frigoris]
MEKLQIQNDLSKVAEIKISYLPGSFNIMKPLHLKVPSNVDQSFCIRKDMIPNINNRWHYHTEIELICFHKGSGTNVCRTRFYFLLWVLSMTFGNLKTKG